MKPSLIRAKTAFEQYCEEQGVLSERVPTATHLLAYFVPRTFTEQAEEFLRATGRETALQFKVSDLGAGSLCVLSSEALTEADTADLAEDAAVCYNEFRTRLSETLGMPLGEMNLRQPTSAMRRASAGTQFPASMQDYRKAAKKKSVKEDLDTKIEEALEGIATPDDIQPQEGLKALFAALKQSGLGQELKGQNVTWHVAEPGRHAITFLKGDVPILQLTSAELGDAKQLGETLSQLTSIAQGKAPQAAQLELDRVKEMAARASQRKGALDDIAQQFAVPKPEDQQPLVASQRV